MIYLDNSATTKPYDEVRALCDKIMEEDFGNPSSMHKLGVGAEKYVKTAKEQVAKALHCKESEIVFTSGGTEADNLAILGACLANKRSGSHIVTTKIEHPAVIETFKFLETVGFNTSYLSVDKNGRVNLEELKEVVGDDTVLVSIMHVNNEIGSANNLEDIINMVKSKNNNILIHVDAVQSLGKYKINLKQGRVDLVSFSSHKIHGPKGVGALYIREKAKINPIMLGGHQQNNLRSGTENVPGIAGFGLATELIYKDFDKKIEKLYELKTYFVNELLKMEDVTLNGLYKEPVCEEKAKYKTVKPEDIRLTAPHIISASFHGVRAEVLLHALEEKEIYVSSGSACSTNRPEVSRTLKAIDLWDELLDSTIRFSMSFDTTKKEIDTTLKALKEIVPNLRKYTRK